MRQSARPEHGEPAGAAALGELPAEPALAEPGLGNDADDRSPPFESGRERCLERAELLGSSDEAREAALAGDVEAGAHFAQALKLIDPDCARLALHREAPEVFQAEEPRHELGRRLREVGFSRLRELLHPRREPDRLPLGGVVHPQIVADPPDDDLARVEAHPHREVEALGAAELGREGRQLALEVEGRETGALRVVLVGDRRPE